MAKYRRHEDRREALEEQRARLQRRIVELEGGLAGSEGDTTDLADLNSVRAELAEVLQALQHLEDGEAHDPKVVEMGDTVTVREESSSETEDYTIVEPVEARVDESWISSESPLGAALLGRRAGETVNVHAPAGALPYAIVSIRRR